MSAPMDGHPDHFTIAETCLELADMAEDAGQQAKAHHLIRLAQVHATLATIQYRRPRSNQLYAGGAL